MKISELVKKFAEMVAHTKRHARNSVKEKKLISYLVYYRVERLIEKYQSVNDDVSKASRDDFFQIRTQLEKMLLGSDVSLEDLEIDRLIKYIEKTFPIYPAEWENKEEKQIENKENNTQPIASLIKTNAPYFIFGETDKWDAELFFNFIMSLPDAYLPSDVAQYALGIFIPDQWCKSDAVSFLIRKKEDINYKKFISLFQIKKSDCYKTPEELYEFYNQFTPLVWSGIKELLQISATEMTIHSDAVLEVMKTSIAPYKWPYFLTEFSISITEVIGQTLQEQIAKMATLSDRKELYSNFVKVFRLNKSHHNISGFVGSLMTIPSSEWHPILSAFQITKADLPKSADELIRLVFLCPLHLRKHFLFVFHLTNKDFHVDFNGLCEILVRNKYTDEDIQSFLDALEINKNNSYFKRYFSDILHSISPGNFANFVSIFKLERQDFYKNEAELVACIMAFENQKTKFIFLDTFGLATNNCLNSVGESSQLLLSNLNCLPISKWSEFLGLFGKQFCDIFKNPTDLQMIFNHSDVRVDDWENLFILGKTNIKQVFPTPAEQSHFFSTCLAKKNWKLALSYFDKKKEAIFSNRDELFTFMLNVKGREDWNALLDDFDFATYKKLMLSQIKENGADVIEMAKLKMSHFTFLSYHQDRNRMIGYCLVVGYIKELAATPPSFVRNYTPRAVAYHPSDKDDAAKQFLKFLQSPYELTEAELDLFLQANNKTNVKGLLLNSKLGGIVREILSINSPAPAGMMSYIGLTFSLTSSSSRLSSSQNTASNQQVPEYKN